MRLFISYARVDKPYCIQINDTLEIHEVWYDQRLYAGQHWWKEILRRLDWCEGFIYLLSPESVSSEYCQKEYAIAKKLEKHIFPVLIYEGTKLPGELSEVQYADFTNGLTPQAVKTLLNAIAVAERETVAIPTAPPDTAAPPLPGPPLDLTMAVDNPTTVIGQAAEAMEAGRFDQAVFLLRQAQSSGYKSRFIDLDALLREAEAALERQVYMREAEREYKPIAELVKHMPTSRLGCEAFAQFRKDFPEYDPDNIATICSMAPAESPTKTVTVVRTNGTKPKPPTGQLSSLSWCEITAGPVTLLYGDENAQQRSIKVTPFMISKFPITNAQYQVFIDDSQGYVNPRWWDFSPFAYEWWLEHPTPKPPSFYGMERPRENVSWYEAMAFCNWLSDRAGMNITLPSTEQWQRAAQGDDGRLYPWGNEFDKNRCNTRESKIRMTTLVMRYDEGISPFNVYDMAGNTWEWCRTAKNGILQPDDLATNEQRIIRGGSFISGHNRAQTRFHFAINPEYYYDSIGFRVIADSH